MCSHTHDSDVQTSQPSIKTKCDEYETIVACATSIGRSGVSVVRISGPLVSRIALNILGAPLPPPRYALHSDFLGANGKPIDRGIALYFPAPRSFTGEDILELQGHGGSVVVDGLIERAIELGARLAYPGEFSERAFLNGKIDLTQAEAIADLIDATSKQAAACALRSLQGEFSRRVHAISSNIMQLRATLEAALDFADEDIEVITAENLRQRLMAIEQEIKTTLRAAEQGALLNQGVRVVIAGKPNSGKSSLLNCLSGEERAIVTPLAGTTRDIVSTQIKLRNGLVLELLDTAGLRETTHDAIEQEGMQRARTAIATAQYILLVIDCNTEGVPTPQQLIAEYKVDGIASSTHKLIVVYNKIDLLEAQSPKIIIIDEVQCVFLTAKKAQGIDLLRQVLSEKIGMEQTSEDGFSARRRHVLALQEAKQHLIAAHNLGATMQGASNLELIAEELREAQQNLGTITGEVTTENLLDVVFGTFCVGK